MTTPPAAPDQLSRMTEPRGGKALFSTGRNGHANKIGLYNQGMCFLIPNVLWLKSRTLGSLRDEAHSHPIQDIHRFLLLPYVS